MEQISEIFGLTLFSLLNPITWVVVIVLSVWTKKYWKPTIASVGAQIACITLFIVYLIFIEGDESFGELWNEIGIEGIAFVLAVCTLSGIIMSTLVFLFVQQRRIQKTTSVSV